MVMQPHLPMPIVRACAGHVSVCVGTQHRAWRICMSMYVAFFGPISVTGGMWERVSRSFCSPFRFLGPIFGIFRSQVGRPFGTMGQWDCGTGNPLIPLFPLVGVCTHWNTFQATQKEDSSGRGTGGDDGREGHQLACLPCGHYMSLVALNEYMATTGSQDSDPGRVVPSCRQGHTSSIHEG